MKTLSLLTLVVTDACNFSCSYCPQSKGTRRLSWAKARTFLELFFPRLSDGGGVNFYGGEPLLVFDLIRETSEWIEAQKQGLGKEVRLGMATNGSLLTAEMIDFFERRAFRLLVSFDGLAQEEARRRGTFSRLVETLRTLIAIPGLSLGVSCTFDADTVGRLSESLAFIQELGIQDIILSIDTGHPWNEGELCLLEREMKRAVDHCLRSQRSKSIPLVNFRSPKRPGIFACQAGRDRLSLDADGRIWGCHLFSDPYLRESGVGNGEHFCLGSVIEWKKKEGRKGWSDRLAAYDGLSQNMFYTTDGKFCFSCPDWKSCRSCPAVGLRVTGKLGCFPPWHCRIKRVERAAVRRVRQACG